MSSVAEPSPAHVADSPAQDPPAEQQGDADSESAASEPVHLFLVEDLKTFPTIAVSGVEADDKANGDYFPTLYGDLSDGYSSSFWAKRSGRMAWERRYQPENCTPEESARALEAAQQRENATVRERTQKRQQELDRLYRQEDPKSERPKAERNRRKREIYEQVLKPIEAAEGTNRADEYLDPRIACEFCLVFHDATTTHAESSHWSLYRHMAGSRRRLVEGPPNDGGEQRHREMPPESGWRFIGPGTPDGTFYNLNGEPAGSVVVQYK
eukprot:TRINITY_DN38617_c0_g1_i1.p1 TRINITY_DN38617_c0_g1~~TRINITY_DN38617_c0_g1_i1.p1  ORF type:complete len:268 (-),score=24.73 TRINITY_DN38617_c0_g1_i1:51-854(-)